MKKIIIAFLVSTYAFAQTDDCKCDYIKDYYQLVYEAEISYMQNDFDKAYDLLKQAEKNCDLLYSNRLNNEIEILIEITFKKEKHRETLYYVELVLKNGGKLTFFENHPTYEGITKIEGWTALKDRAQQIYYDWYTGLDLDLRHELAKMIEEDQRVRQGKSQYDEEMREVDDYNEARFKEILAEYGYPNRQIIGDNNIDERDADVSIFAYHVKDTDYFKSLFLEYVRCGKAPVELYATLIDSYDRRRGMFTFGIYQNVTPEHIDDFENLDQRRINAGLRPYEMEKLYQKLFREKYKEYFERVEIEMNKHKQDKK
ncbi:MAG: hypothetical protein WCY89_05215 [Flavobacteriaceae bacterium]